MRRHLLFATLLFSFLTGLHAADFKISGVFSDHMVLQRHAPVPVWGWGKAGEQVSVEFSGQVKQTSVDAEGKWLVKLDALAASTEPRVLKVRAGLLAAEVKDVLVGDVWLLAGTADIIAKPAGAGELAAPTGPPVRIFECAQQVAKTEQADVSKGRWNPILAGKQLSAEACSLGQQLAADQSVPVGIVCAYVGYTPTGYAVESWMSQAALKPSPEAAPILAYYASDAWKMRTTGTYEERLKAWLEYCQKLPLNPPPKPAPADAEALPREEPAGVWNGVVAPLASFAMRGIIWDHGTERKALGRALQQGKLLAAMIGSWRAAFGQPSLPFVIVQVRPHHFAIPHGLDSRLIAEFREGQLAAAKTAGATVVNTIDLGEDPSQTSVCQRVAQSISATVYHNKSFLMEGPELESTETQGNKVILHFRNTQGGLGTADGGALKGFAMASSLYRWVWADAEIHGDTVVVSAPTVDKPEGVRYAYQDLPTHGANLVNGARVPALPFRTDEHLTCTGKAFDPGATVLGYNARIDLGIENPRLPRVLIIGDSISGHYIDTVKDGLRDRANVIGESSMKKDTWASMDPLFYRADWAAKDDNLKKFLAERGPFHIVHFNNGIHNFSRAKSGDEKPYAEQLRKVVATIRESGAICLFANSTGTVSDNAIPNSPNYLTNCRAFNAAAEQVMNELKVPVTDLYGALQPRIKELISTDLIHPIPEANPIMGKAIIARIDEALAQLGNKQN